MDQLSLQNISHFFAVFSANAHSKQHSLNVIHTHSKGQQTPWDGESM